jgi:mycothiol synthase
LDQDGLSHDPLLIDEIDHVNAGEFVVVGDVVVDLQSFPENDRLFLAFGVGALDGVAFVVLHDDGFAAEAGDEDGESAHFRRWFAPDGDAVAGLIFADAQLAGDVAQGVQARVALFDADGIEDGGGDVVVAANDLIVVGKHFEHGEEVALLAGEVGDGEGHVPEGLGLAVGAGADDEALGGGVFKFEVPGDGVGAGFGKGIGPDGKKGQDQQCDDGASDGVNHRCFFKRISGRSARSTGKGANPFAEAATSAILNAVGILSNLSWLRIRPPAEEAGGIVVRPAADNELSGAVRLILGGASGHADEMQVKEFLRLAGAHRRDAGGVCLAEQGGKILSAVLPVVSPGKTMLLFLPAQLHGQHGESTRKVIEAVCARGAAEGVHLAQALLEVHDEHLLGLMKDCGFGRLAELLYLQAVMSKVAEPQLPPGCKWITYAPARHELFASTIMATYQDSFDCPGLNGLRNIDDILAGHRATGDFDPECWFLLIDHDTPVGAVLLSKVHRSDVTELVYLGLIPGRRGKGLADILMRRAATVAMAGKHGRLSLAVDGGNTPALKLYWRHGMQVIGRKLALLRDLRAARGA